MNKLMVRMPRRLIQGTYFRETGRFRPTDDCCALGYLMNKLYGVNQETNVDGIIRVQNLLVSPTSDYNISTITMRNDKAKTNADRLDAFRLTCAELGVEIDEN